MEKQFAASEVRELAKRGSDAMQQFIEGRHTLHIPPQPDDADMVIVECLRAVDAFADMLEAREKAVPVAWLRDSGVDIESEAACVTNTVRNLWLASNPKRIERYTIPLYTHPAPSDAERLAEALRNLVSEWAAIADDGDATLEDSTIGYRACANRLSAMLAAHHAQAQPPAASVTDAMMERGLKACIQDSDARLPRYKVVRSIIEAALAAQENPDG